MWDRVSFHADEKDEELWEYTLRNTLRRRATHHYGCLLPEVQLGLITSQWIKEPSSAATAPVRSHTPLASALALRLADACITEHIDPF